MEMLLTGDQVPGERLYALGLVNRLLPGPEVLPAAMEVAARIAANGPVALAEIKRATGAATGRPLDEGFAIETESMDRVMATEDAREGPRAFMERRPPIYSGR